MNPAGAQALAPFFDPIFTAMAPSAALPGFNTPAVGFEAPFAMLQACHERVQRTLVLLERLRDHVRAVGADASARDAAADVLRYFDKAAPLHHEDEELHIFARLQGLSPEHQLLVERLRQDHRLMASDWAAARVPLAALASGQQLHFSLGDDRVLQTFASRYEAHIAAEESLAYPAVQALLTAEEQAAMGRDMAARRRTPPLPAG